MTFSTAIRNLIRAKLLLKGQSVRDWSREHGYQVNFVSKIISLYAGTDKKPRGEKTLEVLRALEADTKIKICG